MRKLFVPVVAACLLATSCISVGSPVRLGPVTRAETTSDGRSCFEIAMRSGKVSMVKLLVERGFDPSKEKVQMAYSSMKPIAFARQNDYDDIVAYPSSLGLE